jgi:hypothetical protein
MAVTLTIKGVSYTYPEVDNEDWGDDATRWAAAVTSVISVLKDSPSSPVANTGVLSLGNGDGISWASANGLSQGTLSLDNTDHLIMDLPDGSSIDMSTLGTGDVHGPSAAVDNAVARFDLTTGKIIQNSVVTISDAGDIAGVNVATANTFVGDITANSVELAGLDIALAMVPIGGIIDFFNFPGLPLPNATYWALCNGQTVTITGIGSTVLPDYTGRYSVGAANASVTPVGAASHQVNLAHTHTGPSHTHTGPSHTHPLGSGSYAQIDVATGGTIFVAPQTGSWTAEREFFDAVTAPISTARTQGTALGGATDASGTGATGASGTGATGSGGSATQSIQPDSISAQKYIRIK